MKIEVIYNVITTNKINESVQFYKNYFGFEVISDLGWYKHLRDEKSGFEIAFMEPNNRTQPPMFQPEFSGKGLIISIQVDSIDDIYNQIKKSDIKIGFDLHEEEWGQIHFGIYDPNMIPIDVVKYTKDT